MLPTYRLVSHPHVDWFGFILMCEVQLHVQTDALQFAPVERLAMEWKTMMAHIEACAEHPEDREQRRAGVRWCALLLVNWVKLVYYGYAFVWPFVYLNTLLTQCMVQFGYDGVDDVIRVALVMEHDCVYKRFHLQEQHVGEVLLHPDVLLDLLR